MPAILIAESVTPGRRSWDYPGKLLRNSGVTSADPFIEFGSQLGNRGVFPSLSLIRSKDWRVFPERDGVGAFLCRSIVYVRHEGC